MERKFIDALSDQLLSNFDKLQRANHINLEDYTPIIMDFLKLLYRV